MKQTHPFWKYVSFTLLGLTAVIFIILFFFWNSLNNEESTLLIKIFNQYYLYIIGILFISGCAVFFGLEFIFNEYIKPLKKISSEASMIVSSNHSHRLNITGNKDIKLLSSAINNFAENLENMDKNITEQALTARKDTEKERNLLAAIMAELPQGVVICNKNGRILLFNNLAKTILTQDAHATKDKYFIGIGRSLFKLINKNLLLNAIKNIEQHLQQNTENMASFFVTSIQTGHLISAEAIPILDQKQEMTGFILTFQDVTEDITQYDITHEKFTSLKQDLTGYTTTIKKAINQSVNKERHKHLITTLDQLSDKYDQITNIVLETLNPETSLKEKQRSAVFTASRPEFYDFDLFKAGDVKAGKENIDLLDTNLKDLMYTVFDTETTGLDPDRGDEIISIGAVRISNNKIVYHDLFEELVDPKRDIPLESYNIHGINYEMVAGKKDINATLPIFKNYTSQSVLVGHNIAFDMKMLKVKEKTTNIKFSNPVLDTLLLSAILHPSHEKHDMESIAKRLGIDILGRHTALGDAMATAEIFLKLIDILNSNGILTLKDAINASQRTYYSRLKY
ncbi:MAG: exonuclease domain-containing protein [Deltaproteobacteria bacterium]|jgi:DNA polymerase III epsilon subunit family exonuclease|nr:exonuclease domain-containing protein [Deltaproteobacteria bacterium]